MAKASQTSAWSHRYIGDWVGKTEGSPTGFIPIFWRLKSWKNPPAKVVDFEPLGALFGLGGLEADLTPIWRSHRRRVTSHLAYVYENGANSANIQLPQQKTRPIGPLSWKDFTPPGNFKNSENPCRFLILLNCEFQNYWYFVRRMQKLLRDTDGIIQK